LETQRHPNEPIKPTATGQEGGQQGGGSQERNRNKERDRDKQGGGSQERERELQPCKIEVTKLSANLNKHRLRTVGYARRKGSV